MYPWRGAVLVPALKPQQIWSVACLAEKYAKPAAPANNPALSNSNDCVESTKALGETSRRVVSGSRLFHVSRSGSRCEEFRDVLGHSIKAAPLQAKPRVAFHP